MKNERLRKIGFINSELKKSFKKLKSGKTSEKELAKEIDLVFDELEKNEQIGIKIASKQWPKEYVKKYALNNLWKYDLSNGWRLIYTINGNNVEIISIILEWISHKDYERKFGYKRS